MKGFIRDMYYLTLVSFLGIGIIILIWPFESISMLIKILYVFLTLLWLLIGTAIGAINLMCWGSIPGVKEFLPILILAWPIGILPIFVYFAYLLAGISPF